MFDALEVGNRIKTIRTSRGMERGELAARVNVQAATVGSWERGERIMPLDTAVSVASALGVDVDVIACRKPFVID